MKLAIVSRAENVSGKEIMTLELGEGLHASQLPVEFVTSFWNDGAFQQRLSSLGLPFKEIHLGAISATVNCDCVRMTLVQMLHLPALWSEYRRFLRESSPERIIHTSWHHMLLLWPFLKPQRDWFWIHEILPNKPQYRFVFQKLARSLVGFIAISQAVADSLKALGIEDSKIRVIYNGLRDPRSSELPERVGAARLKIGVVGQVESWKGHHDLLHAFARLSAKHPAAEVHIFGNASTTYGQEVKQHVMSLGLSERVFWHGFVEDRSTIYQDMNICVVPSNFDEPFGLVAVEAGFFELPVLANRCGGLPEIVEDQKTGFLVEPRDLTQLADRLDELLSSAPLRHSMGQAGRAKVERLFGRERFVMEFVHLMNQSVG